MIDLLFRNGEIIDGTGKKLFKGDVAVQGNKIVEIGSLAGIEAEKVVDITGKVISPGFIDMHSHTDTTLPVINHADSLVYQGITTAVTGHCGISPSPLREETREQVIKNLDDGEVSLPWDRFMTFGGFLDYLEEIGTSINVTPIVGQGIIRAAVMGFSAARPSEEQMEQMQQLVIESMDQGAIGISTGLIYPPGSYASTQELIEVTKPVGERGGIYFSHIRGEGDTLLDATKEEIEIGRRTGSAIHHSHFKAAGRENWDKAIPALELIEKACAEGLDMTADMYPYIAGSTSLGAILPEWAQEGGLEVIAQRLMDPETRRKMVHSMQNEGFFKVAEWNKVLIPGSANPAHVGKYISELAESAGKSPFDWIFDALLETRGQIGMILFMMDEANVKMQLSHPSMMIGTDGAGIPFEGPFAKGAPHPRSFGTYPRVLGKYVRQEKALTLEDAVRRMTGYPAQKLGFKERGLVAKGYKADLVIFDPDTVLDQADFVNPFQKPLGIEHVLVNGRFVIEAGVHTRALPGVITSRE